MSSVPVAEVWEEASLLISALLSALAGNDPQPATNTPKPALDTGVLLIFSVGLFLLNWVTRLAVFNPLAKLLVTKGAGERSRAEKFGQSASEAFFYGASFALGVIVVPRQAWIWPSAMWWDGKTSGELSPTNPHAFLCDDLKCYILLYLGRYLQGLVSVFLEHKRKDFLEMLVHHSTTVLLIALSYTHQYNRVGVVVMILLDPADVPLHSAKMCKYMGRDVWADVFFIIFGVSFFVTRLILYPYVVWSSHFEAVGYLGVYQLAEWVAVGLLYILQILQVYWMLLILKVACKLLNSGGADDIRSDSDSDSEGEAKRK